MQLDEDVRIINNVTHPSVHPMRAAKVPHDLPFDVNPGTISRLNDCLQLVKLIHICEIYNISIIALND